MSVPRVARHRRHGICVILLLSTVATSGAAHAADGDTAAPETRVVTAGQPPRRGDPDFLFGRPRAFVGVAGGWLLASQSGDIFDLTRNLLTVEEGNFDTAVFRFETGWSLGPRLDVVAQVGFSRATIPSEYRDFVDDRDLPIVQTTQLTQVPVGGSARLWLTPRGREVGRFAWVPSRVSVYTGVGGGALWYEFAQFGDFVDFVDFSIFTDELHSSAWTASGHVLAGASISLTRQLFLGVEARYRWAATPLSGDFVGFDNISLSGVQPTVGIEFVF